MKALEVMALEHEAIGRMLTRLEAEIDGLGQRGELDVEAIERVLAFCEERVDGQHQEKEERVFLPRLVARAEGDDATLARAAAADHRAERKMLTLMRSNLEGATYGEPNSLAVVVRLARGYVQFQREHSRWESTVLFALARRVLSQSDDHDIVNGFQCLDLAVGSSVLAAAEKLSLWLDQHRASISA